MDRGMRSCEQESSATALASRCGCAVQAVGKQAQAQWSQARATGEAPQQIMHKRAPKLPVLMLLPWLAQALRTLQALRQE